MNQVIVSGANGFIGSRLVKFLSKKGISVVGLVQTGLPSAHIKGLENVRIKEFDLSNLGELENDLPSNADVLYHLAWNGVCTSQKDEYDVQMGNIHDTLNILKIAKIINCRKIVIPGSVSEYAYSAEAVNGQQTPSPADVYSASKIATHYLCDIFARQNNMDMNWLLISSVYGPGREDNNLITYAIRSFLQAERPSFTKLEQKWDFLYIDDLVYALYLIGEYGKYGKVYPIGSGENRTLLEYVKIIRDAINPNLKMEVGKLPYKTDRIDNSIVDIAALSADTGFLPKFSFNEGIRLLISQKIE